jgi:hypothetical protein
MKRALAAFVILMLPVAAIAAELKGRKLADGSTLHEMKDGVVLARVDGNVFLVLPNARHLAGIGLAGFELEEVNSKREGVMLRTAANADGFIVSAYFEKYTEATDADSCRKFYFTYAVNTPTKKDNVGTFEMGEIAGGSYMIKEAGGVKLNQQHWNLYRVAEGYCLDVHVSKMFYDPAKDDAVVKAMIGSIKVEEKK